MEIDDILYENLTSPEIADRIQQGYMAALPCGCIEQSGPHLPVSVDSWFITSLVREGALMASQEHGAKVLVLPTQHYGFDYEHSTFPGTISLHYQTHFAVVYDILDSLVRHGFKAISAWPGCGGHHSEPVAAEVKRKAREEGKQVSIFTPRVDLHSIMKQEWPGIAEWHAGESTTSILLAKWPEAVRLDRVNMEARSRPFRIWDEAFMTDEAAPDGDSGKPGSYSKEKGKKVWNQSVEAAAKIFKDIWELVQTRK